MHVALICHSVYRVSITVQLSHEAGAFMYSLNATFLFLTLPFSISQSTACCSSNHGLDLLHDLRVAQVHVDHLLRILVARAHLLDARAQLSSSTFRSLSAITWRNQQAQAARVFRPPRRNSPSAAPGRDPRYPCAASRHAAASALPGVSASCGMSSGFASSRPIHNLLTHIALDLLLCFALHVFPHVLAELLQAALA